MIELSACKKTIFIIFIIFLIISILISVITSFIGKINTTKNLYIDVSYSFKSLANKFDKSLSEYKKFKSETYTLDVCLDDISDLPCSGIVLSNNSHDKYCELSLQNLKLQNKTPINLSTFATNDKIGFYFDNNPNVYYTANGKKFRSSWNKSVYSNFVKIPEYVPENINYNKINTMLSLKNLCKIFVGAGLGTGKPNLKQLFEKMNISSPESFVACRDGEIIDAQIVHLTLPVEYIEQTVKKLADSSANAKFDYINNLLVQTESLISNVGEKIFKIDFVIYQNTLLWAETSINLSTGLFNACLNIYENEVSFELKRLSSNNIKFSDLSVNIKTDPSSAIKLSATRGNRNIMNFELEKLGDSAVTSRIIYSDNDSVPHCITALYSKDSKKYNSSIPSKNIYNLSVGDLFRLYQKIDASLGL